MTPQGYPLWLATATAEDPRTIEVGRVIGWTEDLRAVVAYDDGQQLHVGSTHAPDLLLFLGDTRNDADSAAQEQMWAYCRDGHGKMAADQAMWRCQHASCGNAATRR